MSKPRLIILSLLLLAIGTGGSLLTYRLMDNPQDAQDVPIAMAGPDTNLELPAEPVLTSMESVLSESSASGIASADAVAVLKELMRRDSEGLVQVKQADDHVMVDLQGRYTHMSAGIPNPETGEITIQCFAGFDELKETVAGTAQPETEIQDNGEVADY